MRARSLTLAALCLLAMPAALAQSVEPPGGWACVPESPLCQPATALCPRLGGTFGYCLAPIAEDRDGDGALDAAGASVAIGNHGGPAAWAWVAMDARSGPAADARLLLLCGVSVVLPFAGEPPLPCALDAAEELADL